MKLTIIFILLSTLAFSNIPGQNFEIAPFAAYMFAGSIKTDKGDLNIKNGFNYGAFLDITTNKNLQAEFWYSRLTTELYLENPTEESGLEPGKLFDMNVEYFHAGGIRMESLGKFRPYAAISLGATRFTPLDYNYKEDWRFSVTIGGGGKFLVTETLGLRFDWRVLVPIYSSNAKIYCSNGGCVFHVEGGTIVLQAHMTAGIILLL